MSHNFFSNMNYSHGVNKNWTPNFANYTLSQFRSTWSSYNPELSSVAGNPMLDSSYAPQVGSPVINMGLGDFYDESSVNVGIYLQ